MIAIGIAALLAVGVVAFVGARLAQSPSAPPPTEAAPQPGPTWQESQPAEPRRPAPPETVTHTATVTQPPAPPRPAPPAPSRPSGDLGLPTPMRSPSCNGQGIVVLGSVTTPGRYAEGVQRLLNVHPGASYLRTDQSCPLLRQADDKVIPSTPCTGTLAQLNARCVQRFAPQAAALTGSGWTIQPIPGT